MKGIDWKQGLVTLAAVVIGMVIYDKLIAPRLDAVVPA
jgi:hypothetical protein